MDEEKEGKMYTQEELKRLKEDYSQEQKMDFMIDMINDNSREIKDIKDTLHNGWDRQLWYNSIVRKGALWLFGIGIASSIGYLFSIM
ncbi:MAG: hypothetical protein K9L56_15450 [Clostridiales bacterium]|nr:hypothetical protein [Clostridiales bacterium]